MWFPKAGSHEVYRKRNLCDAAHEKNPSRESLTTELSNISSVCRNFTVCKYLSKLRLEKCLLLRENPTQHIHTSVDATKTVEFDADNLHVLAVWTVIELQLFVNVVEF